ncbi:Peptidase E [Clostridium collagenovorans DSM 3089]|uniref:Peptidase E n=1 Tax=Clostridium collagenovorans DSM 3089 TaxID=1121306 RepID=A0A1M5S6E3_9CLOT|nr:Type 1 glutamine amidotransferase-like domain-containing protein [Clostridium collagenovorans]SHH33848.1 Peptidase E [Clostridium collagenovorans DSM 3089]
MNILLDGLDFHESWAYKALKNIIKPEYKICVIPFAFHEDWIKNEAEWKKSYNKISGEYYKNIVTPFYTYGIEDDNVTLVNYFTDSSEGAKTKINSADIVFFTGGFPNKIMSRLLELDLVNTVEHHSGIIMGWSAGAMIQCSDYYISPDKDYPEFIYEKGLRCIENFAVEVHYKNTDSQKKSIEKYIRENRKMVYTTQKQSAIIVDSDKVTLLGNAKVYKI